MCYLEKTIMLLGGGSTATMDSRMRENDGACGFGLKFGLKFCMEDAAV